MFTEQAGLNKTDNEGTAAAIPLPPRRYTLIETKTIGQLVRAMNPPAHYSSGLDPELKRKLQIMINATHRSGSKLFVVDFMGGPWCLIAPDVETINKHQRQLMALDEFQANIIPERLWGRCIFIHEYARLAGVADDIMLNGQKLMGESIFQIRGIHNIGRSNCTTTQTSLYFDLTSMAYIFTAKGQRAEQAICRGLAVFEPTHSSSVIQGLYANYWNYQQPWGNMPTDIELYKDCFIRE